MITLERELARMPKYVTLDNGKRVKSYCGELYSEDGAYVGNVYRVSGGYEVFKVKEGGRGERVARLPGTFKGSDFEQTGTGDFGYATVRYFKIK